MSVMMIFMAIQSISMPLIDISKAIVAARDLFVVIDAPQAAPGSLKPDLPSQDIVFKDVTFEYPSRPGVTVLDGLNVCIKSGQNTALVGPSGSGKSTVVALLERWYSLKGPPVPFNVDKQKPADKANDEIGEKLEEKSNTDDKPKISGSITIGGYNLDDLDLKWWRGHIGLVQQEPFLFNDTIFNNIAKGLIGTQWEDESEERKREMVREACEEAYAEEFITRLPNVSTLSPCNIFRSSCLLDITRDTTLASETVAQNYPEVKNSVSPSPEASSKSLKLLFSMKLQAQSMLKAKRSSRLHLTGFQKIVQLLPSRIASPPFRRRITLWFCVMGKPSRKGRTIVSLQTNLVFTVLWCAPNRFISRIKKASMPQNLCRMITNSTMLILLAVLI